MAQAARTFRIFVSSTFEDLKEERNRLQEARERLEEEVFPELKRFCLAHGTRFQPIDLRWGVSEEASLDQQTINICLTEIERCRNTSPRPNFIILLGDRYGWRPPPPQIPAHEFAQILARVSDEDKRLLEEWYPRDDNAVLSRDEDPSRAQEPGWELKDGVAVLPEHYLRPRERGGPYERYDDWAPVERRLRSILVAAVRGTRLENDPRYGASATEQEIVRGALTVPDAQEHVFCFFREIEDLPRERGTKSYFDLDDEAGVPDQDAGNRLARLKDALRGHLPAIVFACAVSSDGSLAVSGASDKTLRLWDAVSGEGRGTLQGHGGSVTACALSRDGSRIVSASRDKTLKVWDVEAHEQRATMTGHEGLVVGCALSPDGRFVISASEDNTLKVWDTESGEPRATLRGHEGDVSACAIGPDGSFVVSASEDKTLKLWAAERWEDEESWRERATLRGHERWVRACAVCPDGSIVSASDDGTVRVWDSDTGSERMVLTGHTGPVLGCAVSDDGSLIASASTDQTVKLWDPGTGVERATLAGHTRPVTACAVSADGSVVVSASQDGTLKVWDALSGAERATLEGHKGNIFEYTARWAGDGPTGDHLDALAADVKDVLLRVISDELARLVEQEQLEQEVARHWEFGAERAGLTRERGEEASDFTGREDILERIASYVGDGDRHPLAVHGASGSGKSALIAQAAHDAARERGEETVVLRFVGATPESSDGRGLLAGLCRQIARRYAQMPLPEDVSGEERERLERLRDESTVPSDYTELVKDFPQRLELASAERPLIVFLDALDQLSDTDGARSLVWLPAELPEHVRFVVSTTRPEEEAAEPVRGRLAFADPYRVLKARLPRESLVPLEGMEEEEGGKLLDRWLRKAGRTLKDDQRRRVLERFELEGLPLYLKLAFEEVRRWRSDTPDEETELSIGIEDIIRDDLFESRLVKQHGDLLVRRSLGYLAAAKNGLSEDELLDLLSRDTEVFEDFKKRAQHTPPERRLPVVVWSRLHFDLEPYLSERAADGTQLMSFYHRQLRQAVEQVYLAADEKRERHIHLARYFGDDTLQPLELRSDGEVTANLRRLSELPYQQSHGDLLDDVFETLTDFHFLEVKAAHAGVIETRDAEGNVARTYTGVFQLQDDYALALEKFGGGAAAARKPLIVTAVDFRDGNGFVVRCPWCNTVHTFEKECPRCEERHDLEEWRGQELSCPNQACKGPLKVNPFVVGAQVQA